MILMLLPGGQMDSFGPSYQTMVADHLKSILMDDQKFMQLIEQLRHAETHYALKHPTLLSMKHPIVNKPGTAQVGAISKAQK